MCVCPQPITTLEGVSFVYKKEGVVITITQQSHEATRRCRAASTSYARRWGGKRSQGCRPPRSTPRHSAHHRARSFVRRIDIVRLAGLSGGRDSGAAPDGSGAHLRAALCPLYPGWHRRRGRLRCVESRGVDQCGGISSVSGKCRDPARRTASKRTRSGCWHCFGGSGSTSTDRPHESCRPTSRPRCASA